MSTSKIAMLMAAALIGAGICAAEPADAPCADKPTAPKAEDAKSAPRGGRRGPMANKERMAQIFQLNDEEKAALEKDSAALKEQAKEIRAKAMADIKALVEKSFDERVKTMKAAAARLTDEKAKAKAEKIIEMMEKSRDRQTEMQTRRLLAGDRPMMRGGRRGFGGEKGEHPFPGGPRGPRPPADNKE